MKVKAVKGIYCPSCEEFISKEDIPLEVTCYQCGKCEEVFEDKEDAKECCKD